MHDDGHSPHGAAHLSWGAVILHVDMDAFFLSVELLERPDLRGRPSLVAHRGGRSVVLSASYEARESGIRSAMPLAHALARCPGVEVIEPDHRKYTAASARVMEVFSEVTPWVEQLSIDEAFLDVSGARRRLGPPARIGAMIRAEVRRRTGLPCTVGAAQTKSVAKIASTRGKPDGLLIVPPARTQEFLDPLPVSALWGVGPVLERRLVDAGLTHVGQIARQDPARMRRWLGRQGPALVELARGIDPRPVTPDHETKSIGVERTFETDVTEPDELHRALLGLADECARRLRRAGLRAGGVALKVKAPDMSVRTRAATLSATADTAGRLAEAGQQALDELLRARRHPVRLLGIRAERLAADTEPFQASLLDDDEAGGAAAWSDAERVADDIRRRFPGAAVRPASLLGHELPERPRDL
ncbi:DNA polymerase IV [Micrococcus terreus]|uniref:DNA polymerase IV n=1 Tax=Micrococcus terreus TaxID=574650 RepID=A0A1I7MKW9_9MICC|nr:DNA polymerase IV [Micrococcus terreus]SFV22548.1 DNA polymerase-4 [Micrococcus terreus]